MKVGIYNAHLDTIGGGEKHMAAVIDYLQNKNIVEEIEIITHRNLNLKDFSSKLNIDISKCKLSIIDNNSINIEEKTKKYDLFINTTIYSTVKPHAGKNINLIFFPKKPEIKFLAKNKYFKNLLYYLDKKENIIYKKGFYYQEKVGKYFNRKFGNWTENEFSFYVINKRRYKKNKIVISTLPLGQLVLEKNVKEIFLNNKNNKKLNYQIKNNKLLICYYSTKTIDEIKIKLQNIFTTKNDARELGIFITNIYISTASNLFKKTLKGFRYYNYLDYYDLLLVNSKFTKKWLNKFWSKDSKILYPLIESEKFFNSTKKERKIISVGRFFAGSHNKKHLTMIKCFRDLFDSGLLRDWEYHLCGGTHSDERNQNYLAEVIKAAKGYPIFIHSDIPFDKLKDLYAKSKIFWHATGHKENENRNPDKFEHFGITTVEAMASGCIPIVIGRAGQLEIIENNKNGFIWSNVDELKDKTQFVISLNSQTAEKIKLAAIKTSMDYTKNKFYEQLDNVLNGIVAF